MGRLLSLTPNTETVNGNEVSVYVKGFNSRGHDVEHFATWLQCHLELARERGWGPAAFGFDWDSGWVYSVRGIPVPFVSMAYGAWRVTHALKPRPRLSRFSFWMVRPRGFFAALAVDLSLMSARLWTQFIRADQRARDDICSQVLARELCELRKRFQTVRVIAHSLGCAHVVHAVRYLEPECRPDEVHLLAPAVTQAEAALLPSLARRMTYVYHCPRDLTCAQAFRLLRREAAVGATGRVPVGESLTAVDVSRYFGRFVHRQYQHRFHLFAQ